MATTITCKAAVVFKSGEPPKVVDIQVDPPKSSEIRIKMLYASLCHTDIGCCHGIPLPLFPRVPGHEGVGVIESVGENVRNLKEGDIVMTLYIGECGECMNCKSGRSNLCLQQGLDYGGLMQDGTSRLHFEGQRLYHLISCSTWSEYAVLNANYALKVDPSLPLAHASLLSCGFTTGFGTPWKQVSVEKGSTVAVLGLGAVGLGAIAGAQMQGASKIIGVDLNPLKKEKGELYGMTDFINPKESDKSVSELIKYATGGVGVDYCIECTGVPALLNEAIEATKKGLGTVAVVGIGANAVEINFVPILLGRTIKGTIFGGVRPHSDLPHIVAKCINKEINLDELLTHEVSLDQIGKAFEYMHHPDCLKILIKF